MCMYPYYIILETGKPHGNNDVSPYYIVVSIIILILLFALSFTLK